MVIVEHFRLDQVYRYLADPGKAFMSLLGNQYNNFYIPSPSFQEFGCKYCKYCKYWKMLTLVYYCVIFIFKGKTWLEWFKSEELFVV